MGQIDTCMSKQSINLAREKVYIETADQGNSLIGIWQKF